MTKNDDLWKLTASLLRRLTSIRAFKIVSTPCQTLSINGQVEFII